MWKMLAELQSANSTEMRKSTQGFLKDQTYNEWESCFWQHQNILRQY